MGVVVESFCLFFGWGVVGVGGGARSLLCFVIYYFFFYFFLRKFGRSSRIGTGTWTRQGGHMMSCANGSGRTSLRCIGRCGLGGEGDEG